MEILWEKEGFQFGFKRWQGWAVSKVLWEWILNVGSKAREGAEAMSLAFVLLDLTYITNNDYMQAGPTLKVSVGPRGVRMTRR